MEIYPWLQSDFERLTERLEDLHHGLMLTGLLGIGKQAFAIILAQKLLCQEKDTEGMPPCGNCQSCRLFSAGTHPDFHLLTSEHQDGCRPKKTSFDLVTFLPLVANW